MYTRKTSSISIQLNWIAIKVFFFSCMQGKHGKKSCWRVFWPIRELKSIKSQSQLHFASLKIAQLWISKHFVNFAFDLLMMLEKRGKKISYWFKFNVQFECTATCSIKTNFNFIFLYLSFCAIKFLSRILFFFLYFQTLFWGERKLSSERKLQSTK